MSAKVLFLTQLQMQVLRVQTILSAQLSRISVLLQFRTKRLDKLAEMYDPDKYTPASIEFVDIAGLVKGASKGEGLGNKFLSNIRECDAIVHVVRCFENDDIIHVEGNINPARDIETINLELILSDVEMLERRIDKTKKMLKGDKKYQKDIDLFERVLAALNEGKPARSVEM